MMRDDLASLVQQMIDKGISFEDARREFDKHYISRIVSTSDGNLGQAAKALGVHRNTLTRKIRDLKLRVPR